MENADAIVPTKVSKKRVAAVLASSTICQGYQTEKESDPSRNVLARSNSRKLASEYGTEGDGGDSGSEYDMGDVESGCGSESEVIQQQPKKIARKIPSGNSAPRKQISQKQLLADSKKKTSKTFNGKKPVASHGKVSKMNLNPPAVKAAKTSLKIQSTSSSDAGIAKLKGIKQRHLPPEEDLLNAVIVRKYIWT